MHPSRDEIKQALLHPDRPVRAAALTYLATWSLAEDVEVLPLVIRAIEQYGWDEAFEEYGFLLYFPQSPETLDWMMARLLPKLDGGITVIDLAGPTDSNIGNADEPRDEEGFDNQDDEDIDVENFDEAALEEEEDAEDREYAYEPAGTYSRDVQHCLREAVATCDLKLLAARDPVELAAHLSEREMNWVRARLALIDADSEVCWRELLDFRAANYSRPSEAEEDDEFESFDEDQKGASLFLFPRIEAIVRDADRWRDRTLSALDRSMVDGPDGSMLQVYARLAGSLRLEGAIQPLVHLLTVRGYQNGQLHLTGLQNECEIALIRIGTEEVATALLAEFENTLRDFHLAAVHVIRKLRNDGAVGACRQLLAKEKDPKVLNYARQALLDNLAPEGIEPMRLIILGQPWRFDNHAMQQRLIGVCTLLGKSLPEISKWRQQGTHAPKIQDQISAMAEAILETMSVSRRVSPEDEYSQPGQESHQRPEKIEPVVNEAPLVGRNDPCPCGSGKKYKKCCWGKAPKAKRDEPADQARMVGHGRRGQLPEL